MQAVFFKSLKVKRTTSTIILEHEDTEISCIPDLQTRAISVLLGGYNQYGRSIDLEKYQELKRKAWELVDEVAQTIATGEQD